jgi:hypothetical protein
MTVLTAYRLAAHKKIILFGPWPPMTRPRQLERYSTMWSGFGKNYSHCKDRSKKCSIPRRKSPMRGAGESRSARDFETSCLIILEAVITFMLNTYSP